MEFKKVDSLMREMKTSTHEGSACGSCQNPYLPFNPEFSATQNIRRPILLPCGDTICSKCYLGLSLQQSASSVTAVCPCCSKTQWINEVLSCDHFVNKLFESMMEREREAHENACSEVICDRCDEATASSHCGQCDVNCCETCDADVHKKGKFLTHERIPIDNHKQVSSCVCKDHKLPVTLVCSCSQCLVCVQCIVGKHQGHTVHSVQEIASRVRQAIKANDVKLETVHTNAMLNNEQMAATLHQIDVNEVNKIALVEQEFIKLEKKLAARKAHLIATIKQTQQEKRELMMQKRQRQAELITAARIAFKESNRLIGENDFILLSQKQLSVIPAACIDAAKDVILPKDDVNVNFITSVKLRKCIDSFGSVGAPDAPTNVEVSDIDCSSAYVAWTGVENAVQYTVSVRDMKTKNDVVVETTTDEDFTIAELTRDTLYSVAVCSLNAAGACSKWSTCLTFKTEDNPLAVIDVSGGVPQGFKLLEGKKYRLSDYRGHPFLSNSSFPITANTKFVGYFEIRVTGLQNGIPLPGLFYGGQNICSNSQYLNHSSIRYKQSAVIGLLIDMREDPCCTYYLDGEEFDYSNHHYGLNNVVSIHDQYIDESVTVGVTCHDYNATFEFIDNPTMPQLSE